MEKFGKSQPITRVEDQRFLTGHGRYMADSAPKGALQVVFLRSQVAHARINRIDLEAAQAAPGVHLVLDADGLQAAGVTGGLAAVIIDNRDGTPAAAPRRLKISVPKTFGTGI